MWLVVRDEVWEGGFPHVAGGWRRREGREHLIGQMTDETPPMYPRGPGLRGEGRRGNPQRGLQGDRDNAVQLEIVKGGGCEGRRCAGEPGDDDKSGTTKGSVGGWS